jgi:hypothetical protein
MNLCFYPFSRYTFRIFSKLEKIFSMKRLLPLLLSCFLLFESLAQDEYAQRFSDEASNYKTSFNKTLQETAFNDSNIVRQNLGFLNGKKPGVYPLPQDNMPCIVPDSTKTVRIPNAWKGPKRIPYQSNPPRIPNPTKPWVPFPIANTSSAAR